MADRRCALLFEWSYRGTKCPLIDRPCDEDRRARADRAAGTLVLVGSLAIGNGAWEFVIVLAMGVVHREKDPRRIRSRGIVRRRTVSASSDLLFRMCRIQTTRFLR